MLRRNFRIYILVIFTICLAGFMFWFKANTPKPEKMTGVSRKLVSRDLAEKLSNNDKSAETVKLTEPVARAMERITKKPFGIRISAQDSPVSPERFSGFHTGVDFETFFEEQNTEVPVNAVCEGPLVQKRFVSGYGGVVVQHCVLEGRDITVVYGHLQLNSIVYKSGDQVSAGGNLGVLGKGFSSETDGERKHLHLGIHLGKDVNLAGYVQKEPDLENWLDPVKYLK